MSLIIWTWWMSLRNKSSKLIGRGWWIILYSLIRLCLRTIEFISRESLISALFLAKCNLNYKDRFPPNLSFPKKDDSIEYRPKNAPKSSRSSREPELSTVPSFRKKERKWRRFIRRLQTPWERAEKTVCCWKIWSAIKKVWISWKKRQLGLIMKVIDCTTASKKAKWKSTTKILSDNWVPLSKKWILKQLILE